MKIPLTKALPIGKNEACQTYYDSKQSLTKALPIGKNEACQTYYDSKRSKTFLTIAPTNNRKLVNIIKNFTSRFINTMELDSNSLKRMSDTIRFLAVDMVQKANSGHPGMPMGLADIMAVFHSYYRHNPKNPKWLNRDRLVFSGGHGSALVYSMLHLWGYDMTLQDLQNFRQLGSKTPGHPESTHTEGIEVTTGPLGQGVANAVGFAFAEKYGKNILEDIINHKVYCFCGDGDLQEGISYEASSLAGHNKLDNLVVIYDSNDITIDGCTDLCFTENIEARFKAQDWDVTTIDGHNFQEIDTAFLKAQKQTKPLLIIARTKIGRGSASMEGSHKTHGAPLGDEEIKISKEKAGWDLEPFHTPKDTVARFRSAIERGELLEKQWEALVSQSSQKDLLAKLVNPNFDEIVYPTFDKADATRSTNSEILQSIAKALPGFIGGSADLAGSNKTELKGMGEFPQGRNIRFGIREHAMAAMTNAMANYGIFIPFNSTFFIFSDYSKPSVRVAALMGSKNFFIWTHDSIGVGEDGGTHQPIEQLSTFRAMPGFYLFRPADGNENVACWKIAFRIKGTCGFALTRQKTALLDRSNVVGSVAQGGYLLSKAKNPQVTLVASGSEVGLALEAKEVLEQQGIPTSIVSVPCFDLFNEQDDEYKQEIIDPKTEVVAIEAASGYEWYKYADAVIGMDSFGESAPADKLFEKFGFTVENIVGTIKSLLNH